MDYSRLGNVSKNGVNKLGAMFASPTLSNSDVKVMNIPLDELESYANQPFKPYSAEAMKELKDSIETNGLLEPIIVKRNQKTGKYTILAGHNRVKAHEELGYSQIPSIDRSELDEDDATLVMLDTNLCQRELGIKEKAIAYTLKHRLYEKKGITNPTSMIVSEGNESKRNVQRYLALGRLNDELLDYVDKEKMHLKAGVDLSYLNSETQRNLVDYMAEQTEKVKISDDKAKELKEAGKGDNTLSKDDIEDILDDSGKKPQKRKAPDYIKIRYADIADKVRNIPIDEVETLLLHLLDSCTDEINKFADALEAEESENDESFNVDDSEL